jgi:hypothetical protein
MRGLPSKLERADKGYCSADRGNRGHALAPDARLTPSGLHHQRMEQTTSTPRTDLPAMT